MDETATAQALAHIFSTIIDGGEYGEMDRYFTPDYIDHSAVGDLHGTDAFAGMLEGFRAAMPGFRHEISDLTVIGDNMAFWQIHLTASFTGEFMGARGLGQAVEVWVANAATFADDGRVREHWGLGHDALGVMMSQMGIDATALASAG
jgi:predicted ester cyclase